MKLLKPTVGLLGLVLMFSCSSDDSVSDPNLGNTPKSNLEIKAVANGTSANVKSAANVEVTAFFINIKNIEFDFADGFGDGNSSGSDDDYLTFEELPNEIVAYLEDNYPNDPFCKGEIEDDDDDEDEDPYAYEIELQSGTEIYFRADFSVYAIESDDDGCDFDDDGDDNHGSYGSDDDFELNGPFELSLNSDVITVINVEIPVGEYEEVEFEMDRSTNPNSDLFQKSILMRGTISGTEFEFFHTFSEEFEVDYEDAGQNLVITEDNNNTIIFEFDLTSVFNSVDLSGATDGNENGVIEISPEDSDGNRQLANRIKNAIKDFLDLLDD
jgi:hypothetical protein